MQGKADTSNIAQKVCLAAHGNMFDFRGESVEEFSAWLRGILTHILAMHVRTFLGVQKRDPRLEQRLDQILPSATRFLQSQIAGDMTTPNQHLERNEALEGSGCGDWPS